MDDWKANLEWNVERIKSMYNEQTMAEYEAVYGKPNLLPYQLEYLNELQQDLWKRYSWSDKKPEICEVIGYDPRIGVWLRTESGKEVNVSTRAMRINIVAVPRKITK